MGRGLSDFFKVPAFDVGTVLCSAVFAVLAVGFEVIVPGMEAGGDVDVVRTPGVDGYFVEIGVGVVAADAGVCDEGLEFVRWPDASLRSA